MRVLAPSFPSALIEPATATADMPVGDDPLHHAVGIVVALAVFMVGAVVGIGPGAPRHRARARHAR